MKMRYAFLIVLLVFTFVMVTGCKNQDTEGPPAANLNLDSLISEDLSGSSTTDINTSSSNSDGGSLSSTQVEFGLRTEIVGGRMVFVGSGGEIEGVVNPDLIVLPGATVKIDFSNGDGIPHDLTIPDFEVKLPIVSRKGDSAQVVFSVGDGKTGTFFYYCTVAGHRKAGQEGNFVVNEP
jgi:nitrite reductase (NO-forming)